MGPLETRALDFKKLVILSADEGIFPHRSVSSSFIPPELRRGFGLPTYEYQDAVWAYYFYRMISRAQKVWMLVDTRTEGLVSGEESRYIKQLEYHFGIPVNRYSLQFDQMKTAEAACIEKTQEDVDRIKNMALSATYNGFYNTAVAVTPVDGTLADPAEDLIWTVGVEGEYYTFSFGGQNCGTLRC